jgi:hypothetical protein
MKAIFSWQSVLLMGEHGGPGENNDLSQVVDKLNDIRDLPFNLHGGYGFLFRSEICFRTIRELEDVFCREICFFDVIRVVFYDVVSTYIVSRIRACHIGLGGAVVAVIVW